METLEQREIGKAEKTYAPVTEQEGAVAFKMPYGEEEYNITLQNEELDLLLEKGFAKILGNQALSGFDAMIDLRPDLPLFVGARSIDMKHTSTHTHDIDMDVSIVTMSHAYEQRGILSVVRAAWNGEWTENGYIILPPLKDPEETVL